MITHKLRHVASLGGYATELALKEAMKNLTSQQALLVATEQVKTYLATFEPSHLGVSWPRERVESVERFGLITNPQHAIPGRYENVFPDDLSNGFIRSIDYLEDALSAYLSGRNEVCVNLSSDAIATIVPVKLLDFWRSNDPESWQIRQKAQEMLVDEETYQKVKNYRNSEIFKNYQIELWLIVANSIDKYSEEAN